MPTQFNFKTRYIFLDYLLLSIALVIPTILITSTFKLSYEEFFKTFSISGNIFHIIFFILLCWLIIFRLKRCRIETRQIVGSLKLKQLPWIILLIVFYGEKTLATGVNYLEYYFANLISPDLVETTVNNLTQGSSYNSEGILLQFLHYLLLMVVLTIVAPITEEFIFRGVFLHRWAVKWGVMWSIILSSLLFGAIHWDIFWFSRAASSIFIALFYIQRNLLVPIILHALNNGLVFIDLLFHHFNPAVTESLNITSQYIWYGILNILLAVPVFIYFLKVPQSRQELPYFANCKKQEL